MIERTAPVEIHWRRWTVDACGLFLILYAAMNLNGILEMITRQEGALSLIVLACSLYVIVFCLQSRLLAPPFSWFAVFMLTFVFFGLSPLVMGGDLDTARVVQYVGTFIYTSAVYLYVMRRGPNGLDTFIRIMLFAFFVNCVAAINSRLLSGIFTYASAERASGFFSNPNETAVMALYFMVVIVTMSRRSFLANAVMMGAAVLTLAMTFSKTGYLVFFALTAIFLLSRRYYLTFAAGVIVLAASLPLLSYIAIENPLGLTSDQRLRIEQISNVFSGQIDNRTTTGRFALWEMGLDRIGSTFPFGGGIGSLHRMAGGFKDLEGDWLGVHNAYLMILGESGLPALLAFMAFAVVLWRSCLRSSYRLASLGLMTIFFIDMLVTHGALVIRLHDLSLALLMAIGSGALDPPPAQAAVAAAPLDQEAPRET